MNRALHFSDDVGMTETPIRRSTGGKMNDSTAREMDTRPEWFAEFERKLVDLIRTAPGSQTQDVGACLTVLIPRGGGANDAVFGGIVTSREEKVDHMREELLTAVVWALLADGVQPQALWEIFERALGIDTTTTALEVAALDEIEDGVVN
jgi:hypothetical protein